MKKSLFLAVCIIFLLILVGCSSNNNSQLHAQAPSTNIIHADMAEVPQAPTADFLRFYAETSSGMPGGQVLGIPFQSFREDDGYFVMDLVYPVSRSEILNDLVAEMVYGIISRFATENTSGNIHMRPRTYAYGDDILGIALDLRFYGDISGFTAEHLVVNYDLYEEREIAPEDLFANGADFRQTLAYLAGEQIYLAGDECFTFNRESIFLHITNDTTTETITLPLEGLGEIWQGPFPAPQSQPSGTKLAITFDDGPHHRFTPMLLDAFAERGVRATFFLLGASAQEHPEIVQRIYDEGHQIGNHSYSHRIFTSQSRLQIAQEIEKTSSIIYDITGHYPTLLRPPFGAFNDTVLEAAEEQGKSVIMWSVDPQDWRYWDTDVTRNHIVARAREGSIILLHDIHESTVMAAIQAVDILLEQGFTFVTVDELYAGAGKTLEAGKVYRGFYRDQRRE
ncbi:MAG: polysaccharide deacetylase family protein [Defluviitaleaceae bacterium]|nr:polysaccharide deacetylase family protein [Defluviitaleaceae bacterium]